MTTTTPKAPGVKMSVKSKPGLRCELSHGPSGNEIKTDAPKDNGGTGTAFSPTDLVGAALASCAVTTMAIIATREGLTFGEASATVEKRMTPPPRRIAELEVVIQMPAGLTAELRKKFEEIARTCPVARSLHPDVSMPMSFSYPD